MAQINKFTLSFFFAKLTMINNHLNGHSFESRLLENQYFVRYTIFKDKL